MGACVYTRSVWVSARRGIRAGRPACAWHGAFLQVGVEAREAHRVGVGWGGVGFISEAVRVHKVATLEAVGPQCAS